MIEHYCDRQVCPDRWKVMKSERYHWCAQHGAHPLSTYTRPRYEGKAFDRIWLDELKPKGEANTDWTYDLETIEELLQAHDQGTISTRSLMDVFGVGITNYGR